jgi:hypothetical protein
VDPVGVLLVWTPLLRFQGPIFGKKNGDWEIFFSRSVWSAASMRSTRSVCDFSDEFVLSEGVEK